MAAEGPDRLPEITDEQVEALADPAFLTDPNGCVAAWNRGATQLLGHTSTEAVGAQCSMLLDGVGAQGAQVCTHPCPMVRGVLPVRRSPQEERHPDMLARNSWGEH